MKLNSVFIKNQEFSKKLLGYNAEEVKAFLNKIAEEVDILVKENETLKSQLNEFKTQIDNYKEIENNLKQTLLKAQENSDNTIASTKKRSQLILMEAEVKANQIIENAKERERKLNEAILNLKEEKNLIIAKLEAILTTQVRLISPEFSFDTSKSFEENLKRVDFLNIDVDKIVEILNNE